jgi:hypothetical protein|tara:strand:+ start:2662 stop:3267 length:606 start_codon:yes stop_codon:yes gene_type:complete
MSKVITTPKGKAVWPRIDTADTKFDEDGVYSCKLHVTEGDFKAFEAIVKPKLDAAYQEECSRQGKDKIRMAASSPLRINDEGDHEIYAKQKAKVHTKSKGTLEFTIAAVDSQGKKIAMPKIGSGSILKMAVEVNTWFVPSQGFGYTLRLRAVQVLDLVEYGGGGDGSFGFGAEADGYVGSGESLNEAFAVADEAETSNAPF